MEIVPEERGAHTEPGAGSQLGYALAMGAVVVAISTAAIFVRFAGDISPVALALGRTLLAGLCMLPWLRPGSLAPAERRAAHWAGVGLAAHFTLWFASLGWTTVAASVLLVTTAPLWLCLLGALRGQRVRRGLWVAVLLGIVGTGLTTAGEGFASGWEDLLGGLLALGGAWAGCFYLVWSRRARPTAPLLPLASLTNLSAAGCLVPVVAVQALVMPLGLTWVAAGAALGMALLPQMIGHNLVVWALRRRGPAGVSLVTIGEPVGAALLAWLLLGEVPGLWTWAGAALILPALGYAVSLRQEHAEV